MTSGFFNEKRKLVRQFLNGGLVVGQSKIAQTKSQGALIINVSIDFDRMQALSGAKILGLANVQLAHPPGGVTRLQFFVVLKMSKVIKQQVGC